MIQPAQISVPMFQAPVHYGWWRAFTWILPGLVLLPVVLWFIKRLDDGSDEPLGLLTLGLALILAWRDRRSLHASQWARTSGALVMLGSVLAIDLLPPMFRAALAIAGIGIWLGFHRRSGLLGLLGLTLPIVASLHFYMGYPLRLAAAEGAVTLLKLSGAVVVRSGVNIELGGQLIGVDPACSGIRMLWHALAAAMALCAMHRSSWRTTIVAGFLAVFLVIPANILRATWLALVQSGRCEEFNPGHGNAGLICFTVVLIPLWWFISTRSKPEILTPPSAEPRTIDRVILLVAGVLALASFVHAESPVTLAPPLTPPTHFTFNGLTLPLEPLSASAAELAFASSFPGSLSIHRWGENQVILRRVTKASRMLHPSRDCLHASGFETTDSITVRSSDGGEWSRFSATRGEICWIVDERMVSEQDGSAWMDVPAWYWSALRHPLNGPWRAETVISR